MRMTFDSTTRDFVLDAFGKTVDADGYIVEQTDPTQKVTDLRGEEIPVSEFAGIRKGSAVFVKSDIMSLIEAAQAMS
jgi:hypothetical protein